MTGVVNPVTGKLIGLKPVEPIPLPITIEGSADTVYLKRVDVRAAELMQRGVRRRNAYRVAEREERKRRRLQTSAKARAAGLF